MLGLSTVTETKNDPNILGKVINKIKNSELRRILTEPLGFLGLILIIIIFAVSIFAPILSTHNLNEINVTNKLAPPSKKHLMGTDHLGRDTFSRVLYGSRVALMVSIFSITFGSILGIVLGMLAGYGSEVIDSILVTLFDIVRSFPPLILAIAIITMIGSPGILTLTIVIGFTYFPRYARVIRAQTKKVVEKEYVKSSEAMGASSIRIMRKSILPNVVGPMFIMAAMDIPAIISFEAGLSFLGLGVPPPTPSWGTVLRNGYLHIRTSPYMVIFGGVALVLATLGFTLLGEALRDIYDPRLRET